MSKSVLVVIGVGGMGEAIARRLGTGRPVVLADFDVDRLKSLGEAMRHNGYDVHTQQVDVSDRESLTRLADVALGLGSITGLVHTAGLSPAQAPADRIIEVDLVGTALSLEVFGDVIEEGGAGVYIASVAGPHPRCGGRRRGSKDSRDGSRRRVVRGQGPRHHGLAGRSDPGPDLRLLQTG